MSTVAEIKAAIPSLTLAEREDIARFLHQWTDDDWDRQMAADAEPGGKLHRLMEQAETEAKAGTLRDFPSLDQK
ncbi:MAG TPA: hypothetical protein VFY06_07855 [Verrucomicrobiae bacterium]|nr:hypothetical protein [Verrucomicrobiae bacterium]